MHEYADPLSRRAMCLPTDLSGKGVGPAFFFTAVKGTTVKGQVIRNSVRVEKPVKDASLLLWEC